MSVKDKIFVACGIVISISSFYYLVIRPNMLDKKLDSCLDSMWSLYGNDDDKYKEKSDSCFREVGR